MANCVLCRLPYERIGNNPWPLADHGRCCDACDEIVIEARLDGAVVKAEVERVEAALMATMGDPRAMAIGAVCASRGPGLLIEKREQLERFKAAMEKMNGLEG